VLPSWGNFFSWHGSWGPLPSPILLKRDGISPGYQPVSWCDCHPLASTWKGSYMVVITSSYGTVNVSYHDPHDLFRVYKNMIFKAKFTHRALCPHIFYLCNCSSCNGQFWKQKVKFQEVASTLQNLLNKQGLTLHTHHKKYDARGKHFQNLVFWKLTASLWNVMLYSNWASWYWHIKFYWSKWK